MKEEGEGARGEGNQVLIRREVSWRRVTVDQSHFFPPECVVSPPKMCATNLGIICGTFPTSYFTQIIIIPYVVWLV